MTRVRFTYGCKLRAGAHTSKDRLEHSQPDVIELFHTKQAFLTLINDVLMNQNSAREIGTLKYFRERIMHYNVPTTVKNNPDAYEEFFVSVGRAYLVEAILEFFGMENTESEPTKKFA